MKDLHSNIKIEQAIAPKTYSTGITGTADIDLAGYGSCEIEITYGDHADTLSSSVDFDVELHDSPDTGAGVHGSWTDVGAIDVLGVTPSSGIINHVEADADTNQVYRVGYVGPCRFLKVDVTANGTHSTGTIIGINVIKGNPLDSPVANTTPTV